MIRFTPVVASLLLAFAGTSTTFAGTINVPDDYATIQDAINASSDGDVINIAAGTYAGASITQSGITIIGSMDTNDDEMPDTVITSPIGIFDVQNVSLKRLSFTIPAMGTMPDFPELDHLSVGLKDSGNIEFQECVFKACGQAVDWHGTLIVEQGGAVYIDTTPASFTSCKFIGNRAAVQGGAIYITNTAHGADFIDCSFEGNACSQMGGAFCTDHYAGTFTFDHCNFSGNSALNSDLNTSFGGAVFASAGNVLFMNNCTFTNNSSGKGGACYATNSSSFVRSGTTFSNNVGKICGGAMFLELSYCEVEDANFCNNEPDHIVGGWIDEGNNSFADECTSDDPGVCVGDTNQDYNVDILDLLFIIAVWGSDNPAGDINDDGWVNVNDMLELLDNWGAICE